jgi:hypothetical protein
VVGVPEFESLVWLPGAVECPWCGLIFESFFGLSPSVWGDAQALVGVHTCQECDYEWPSLLRAWMFVGELS